MPRGVHGDWQPADDRPDPISLPRAQDPARIQELVPLRYGRMAASAFTSFRGSAAVMAWDQAQTPTTGVFVQACCDAHVQNFGSYTSPERHLVLDINDFDETLPAPWEFDVQRMAASIVLDARGHGFGDSVAADTAGRGRRILRSDGQTLRTLEPRCPLRAVR